MKGTPQLISLYVAAFLSIVLLIALFRVEARKRRIRRADWEELITSLAPVKAEWLVLIALEAREAAEEQRELFSDDLWEMLGGWPGVRGMLVNAERLYALAAHAHRWDEQRALQASHAMRAEGRRLRIAALNAVCKHIIGRDYTCDLRQAARAYFEMTESLLELYESRAIRVQSRMNAALRPYLGAPGSVATQPFT